MSFLLPPVGDDILVWLKGIFPQWVSWTEEVTVETARTKESFTPHGIAFTVLTGTQANAIVGKRTDMLYVCSSDPSGAAGGSGFYKWDGVAWSKFA